MEKINLQAQPREIVGRAVKSLRKAGFVPATVYGHGFNPVSVQVPTKDFDGAFKKAGETTIVYLNVAGQDHPTIIHDVMRDPVSDEIIHADFYKVRLDEKITSHIPVVITGEAPAVKNFSGIVVTNIKELEVEALPQDLPHEITIDISGLENLNDHFTVADLKLGSKVEINAKPEDILVLIQEPISEEQLKAELEAPTTAAEDVEVIKKEKPEEEPAEEGEPAKE